MSKKEYNGDSIEVLEFPYDVRTRPGMYIGGTSIEGMHHIFKEIFDNSVDEAVAGYCKEITVTKEKDEYISIMDNGRGIPTSINKAKGVSALELVFTVLHAGGKFRNDKEDSSFKTSSGLHGVGASVTNAVSEKLQVWVKRDKSIWKQEYEKGVKLIDVKKVKDCPVSFKGKSGTYVRFKPDKEIFKHIEIKWDYDKIVRRCREIAFLVPGLQINIKGWEDKEDNPDVSFKYDDGLNDYINYYTKDKKKIIDNVNININLKDLGCESQIVFTYEEGYTEHISTFANNISTHEGGVHLNAFLNALLKCIIEIGEREKITKDFGGKVKKSDVQEGLHAIVLVRLMQPEFEGQTKTKLGNPEIRQPLEEQIFESLQKTFIKKHKNEGKLIAKKILQAVIARENARKAKDLTRKKGGLEHFTVKGKLADCESKNPEECELYLVEGDSAGGSAKQGRNNKFQAILPLRGKVLNVEKSTVNKAMENKEIRSLITALNVTPQANGVIPDIDDLRFHNIVVMCLTGDTKIPIFNEKEITIKELADGDAGECFWVYSFDKKDKKMNPGFAYLPRKTGEASELIEIEFEDRSKIRCTKNHKMILENQKDIEAQNLKENDVLLALDKNKIDIQNKKIIKIKEIKLNKPEPVYNITVSKYHNYMLSNGVLVNNCDADPDGAHIACLIITFFYKFMRTLIERGHVKIACPPLYRIKNGKESIYIKNEEELEKYIKNNKSKKLEINRFKGLGEMNPEQLSETVLNPSSRTLVQLSIEDAEQAKTTVQALFGKDGEGRRKFLFKDIKM